MSDLLSNESFAPEEGFGPLLAQLAAAADLTCKPLRHAARFSGEAPATIGDCSDCCVLFEARNADGERVEQADLELEIYRSGADLNLMLSRVGDELAPLLWHGQHPVWMDAGSGERRERPADGAPLEALARRVRALLAIRDPADP
ncbi:MAG: hypothetical protein VKN17_07340 [Cyanobacteriota bacterium]|nr:hypothetical protein [Synechococcus sp. FGCU3]MEB3105575.1 hypothetical protein [Cyanobacteriota bacterium]